jgi:hypothetical protein
MSNNNKNKKENVVTASKAEGIIKSLVNLVGVTAGIIIVSIGSIMFLESVFKIYIFDIKEDRYNSFEYRCEQFDIDSVEARRLVGTNLNMPVSLSPVKENSQKISKLTKEDKEFLRKKFEECKKETKKEAQEDFERREKMDIAEGIAFMLVGFPLLYFYQRRRKTRK